MTRAERDRFERATAARIQAGDVAAQWELVVANHALAKLLSGRFARRHFFDADDCFAVAEDALFRAAGKFDPVRGRFSTYATHAIRNGLRRLLAAHRRETERLPLEAVDLDRQIGPEPEPVDAVAARDACVAVLEAVEVLSDEAQREVFAKHFGDATLDEIGAVVRPPITGEAVRQRLLRSYDRLHPLLVSHA